MSMSLIFNPCRKILVQRIHNDWLDVVVARRQRRVGAQGYILPFPTSTPVQNSRVKHSIPS